jgi:hypothetical protein
MYDRYGRTLAYLGKADGRDYSVEAARAGAAHSYVYHGHPSARADEIAAAEQDAKAAGRGLWGPPCFGQTTSVPIGFAEVPSPNGLTAREGCRTPTYRCHQPVRAAPAHRSRGFVRGPVPVRKARG